MEQSAILNLLLQQGASFSRTLTLKNDTNPVNLTGFTAKAQVRRKYSNTPIIAEFNIQIDPLNGKITISLDDSITKGLQPNVNRYEIPVNYSTLSIDSLPGRPSTWDLYITDTLGFTTRILEGGVLITPATSLLP